jgi:hypothetical protein
VEITRTAIRQIAKKWGVPPKVDDAGVSGRALLAEEKRVMRRYSRAQE